MVLLPAPIGKVLRAIDLCVLLSDAVKKRGIFDVWRVVWRLRSAKFGIELWIYIVPRNLQILEARAQKCHRRARSL